MNIKKQKELVKLEAVTLYKEGKRIEEIAVITGYSFNWVHKIIKDWKEASNNVR
jgi:transposase